MLIELTGTTNIIQNEVHIERVEERCYLYICVCVLCMCEFVM